MTSASLSAGPAPAALPAPARAFFDGLRENSHGNLDSRCCPDGDAPPLWRRRARGGISDPGLGRRDGHGGARRRGPRRELCSGPLGQSRHRGADHAGPCSTRRPSTPIPMGPGSAASAFLLIDRFLRRNSKSGSSRNIRSHYDVGNDVLPALARSFDDLFLRALQPPETVWQDAQARKYDRLLDLTEDAPDGRACLRSAAAGAAFAERAAGSRSGCDGRHRSRLRPARLRRRTSASMAAPRSGFRIIGTFAGRFHSITSIEMIEAVGERYWPVYFRTLRERLAEGGRAAIQAITVSDDLFPDYRRRSDYIRHYVFPGGMLLSPSRIEAEARRAGWSRANPSSSARAMRGPCANGLRPSTPPRARSRRWAMMRLSTGPGGSISDMRRRFRNRTHGSRPLRLPPRRGGRPCLAT